MKTENSVGTQQELLCINTEKVYDWVFNEATFDLNLVDLDLPLNPATGDQLGCEDIDTDTVNCVIDPINTEVIDREDQQFVIDGAEVTLQLINIRKTFTITIYVNLLPALGGTSVEVGTAEFTRCEQIVLCAPDGTGVNVTYTDLECFVCTAVCNAGTSAAVDSLDTTVSVRLCQSIQSVYDVTLEVMADYCQPRDTLPVPPCPVPALPPQCPVIFPADNRGTTT